MQVIQAGNVTPATMLVRVRHPRIRHQMMYREMGLPGAAQYPMLAEAACQRLYVAADALARFYGASSELLVWDAYRSTATQRAIYHGFMAEIRRQFPKFTDEQIETKTREFVNPPMNSPPHACGGAVDLTLMIEGRPAEMGTSFDAFVPEAASDYYEQHGVNSLREFDARNNRRMLREVMEYAGFVGIRSEWWHFEFGTRYWACSTSAEPLLTAVLDAPPLEASTDSQTGII